MSRQIGLHQNSKLLSLKGTIKKVKNNEQNGRKYLHIVYRSYFYQEYTKGCIALTTMAVMVLVARVRLGVWGVRANARLQLQL